VSNESALRQAREALHLAEGALLQCTPCAAPACAQEQREWLDDAMAACHKAAGAIDAALTAPPAAEHIAHSVYVCPEKDIVCGSRSENWCGQCPLWAFAEDDAPPFAAPPPPAAPAVAPGFALVPKHMTQAMRDVTDTEDWTWEDLLAAAEAITEAEYDEIAAAPAVAVEPLRKALQNLLDACLDADVRGDLAREIDGALLDAAAQALAAPAQPAPQRQEDAK
jgi:hypothetical protein